MRRAMLMALWGIILYLVGNVIVSLIVGSPAVDAWRPVIAFGGRHPGVWGKLERVAAGHAEIRGIRVRLSNSIKGLISSRFVSKKGDKTL